MRGGERHLGCGFRGERREDMVVMGGDLRRRGDDRAAENGLWAGVALPMVLDEVKFTSGCGRRTSGVCYAIDGYGEREVANSITTHEVG